jgi:RHS repeat-associated protein
LVIRRQGHCLGFEGKHGIGTDTDAGGIVLMGARLYGPATGRFLQVDPVFGGSCNAYDYTCQDPANASDLAGTDLGDAGGGDDDFDGAPGGELIADQEMAALEAEGEAETWTTEDQQSYDWANNNQNKLDHIFDDKHNL